MGKELLSQYIRDNYEVHEWKHACAILASDFPEEFRDLTELLESFTLRKSWLTVGGGRKSKVSDAIDNFLHARGWVEKEFVTSVKVDEVIIDSPTHKEDCYKSQVASEKEMNSSTGT